MNDGLSVISET